MQLQTYLTKALTKMNHDWEYKRLGELCSFIGGGTPSKANPSYYTGKIPWATVRDMTEFSLSCTELSITEEAILQSATKLLPEGTIVISTHVGLGKICELMQNTAINQDLKGISFTSGLVSKYFFVYWYRSISEYIISNGRGATVKGVTLDFMKSLLIPVPPLEIQSQIVSELDAINAGISTLRDQIKDLDNLAQSLFYETFGDPISNPKGWELRKIEDLTQSKKNILRASKILNKDNYIKYIDISSINRQTNKIEEPSELLFGMAPSRAQQILLFNDILISLVRPNLKNIAMVDFYGSNIVGSSGFCILRKKESINEKYLFYVILTNSVTEYLCSKISGAAYPAIREEDIKTLKIPVPPLELQEQFALQIEKIESMKSELQSQITEAQTLLNSRLDYWFN